MREKRTEEDLIPPDARAVLRIDLDALRANWRKLNEASGRAECAAVIKADAYGLGIEQICRALTEEGCRTFFVATLDEGRRIRAVQPGAVIYVLDGLLPGAAEYYSGFDLRPALSSLEEIREWAAYCRARDTRLAAAIHIDTGMNRLGLPAKEVDELARNPEVLNDFKVSLIMSHLACADTPASPMNAAQRETFERLTARLP
ncbi:MAG TPA: alanine racemase, partial [Hyphomicrobiaceae bacterium]|nr:alanine racemase [Hyphomicrobiaceae bacterium]